MCKVYCARGLISYVHSAEVLYISPISSQQTYILQFVQGAVSPPILTNLRTCKMMLFCVQNNKQTHIYALIYSSSM